MIYHQDNNHPNKFGSKITAEEIVKILKPLRINKLSICSSLILNKFKNLVLNKCFNVNTTNLKSVELQFISTFGVLV